MGAERAHAGIYIDPPSAALEGDRFLAPTTGKYHSSLTRCLAYVKSTFEAQGIAVHTADLLPPPSGSDTHLYVSVGNHAHHGRLMGRKDVVLSAFMVTESPVVEPRIFRGLRAASRRFKRIYSCIDQREMGALVGAPVECRPLRWPMDFRGVDEDRWRRSGRRFLVMININKLPRLTLTDAELYLERMRAVEFFSRTNEIDLYGVGWMQASMQMGRTRLPRVVQRSQIAFRNWRDRRRPDPLLVAARRVYKGELDTKWDTLADYDFVLCFENTTLRGWVTEKIFEALRVGTIPIYWGASDVEQMIPADCFIDMRRFGGYADLRAYLRSLDAAAVQRYRDAGRAFLESPRYDPFSKEAFAGLFQQMLAEDAGVRATV